LSDLFRTNFRYISLKSKEADGVNSWSTTGVGVGVFYQNQRNLQLEAFFYQHKGRVVLKSAVLKVFC